MKWSLVVWPLKVMAMIGKGLAKILCRGFSLVCKIFVQIELVGAVVLFFASLGVGWWLASERFPCIKWLALFPPDLLGVLVTGVGCSCSGVLFGKSQSRSIALAAREAAKKSEESARKHNAELEEVRHKADELQRDKERISAELLAAKGERDRALSELHERKGCGLDIGVVRDIAELNLSEVNMTIDRFHGEDWEESLTLNLRRNAGSVKRYLGVLRRSCLVKYGIDMRDLLVYETNDAIWVCGLAAKVTGTKDVKDEWLLAQVQDYEVNRISSDEVEDHKLSGEKVWCLDGKYYTIDATAKAFKGTQSLDGGLQKKKDKWAQQLNEEIDAGINLNGINSYVVGMARKQIILLLQPLGKQVRYDERPIGEVRHELARLGLEQGLMSLENFANGVNNRMLESEGEVSLQGK